MTNKIKLLLWSFLTILFVWLSSTYAYDLWGSASQESRDEIIKNVCFKNRKRDYNNYSNWKCPAWEFYIPHGPDPSWFYFYAPLNPYPHFFFLNIQQNGEWFIFRRSIWKNWGLSIKDFSFPSKSWFEYIDPKGKKSILTKVYYWHNTAYFFDPDTMHWFSFIGDRALWNLFLVANPFKDENNLYLINFHNKTAYSKTVDTKIALQYMLGDPQYIDKIKEIKWETSYTLVPWGNEVLPPNFDTTNYGSNWRLWSQGESKGWNYVEDLTVKSPNWYEWSNKSNAETTGNTVAKNTIREEKKSCVAYYTYMRSMSSHSDWCLWEVNKDMSDTRLDYWWAISTDWDLSKFWVRDKTKYRRCWHWNNYKEGVKKTLWDKWPEFWKDRQTNYIATEAKDIDVNALCSHILVEKSFEKTNPFSFSWMVALWGALRGILDNVWQKVKVWDSEIPVNTLSWDIGRYYTYAQACRDKRYMQTPIDSKLSYIVGYDFFFNSSNNEKVCEYAEILKKNIEKKYWGKEIDKKYRDAMANELEEKWTTWDFKNVFNDKWEIDLLKLENSANKTHSNPFKDPEDVLGLNKILWFFQKDFDAWVNLVYKSLSGQRCWEWIWIKEWDYIMRLFVFIIWFVLFKWRN